MMDFGEVNAATKPPIGRRMKSRAPPPPPAPEPAPRRIFRNAVPDGGGQGSMDTKENILRPSVDLHITLPQGYQTTSTVDGSKALMDLLVDLCSQYHLNPAYNTLELLSSEGLPLPFKPNALLGTLDVACVLIKEKVWEEKVVRKPPPKVPEKTVRLVVNYHRSQKALVRVNPLVPLESLVPAICEKCEFEPAHVLLLKDNVSNHELELDKSLTELGIRELYVLDQTLESIRSHASSVSGSEKKGLLGFLKFNRRKSKTEEQDMDDLDDNVIQNTENCSNGLSTVSIIPCAEARPSTLGQSQSVMNISRMSPKVEPKKRRAPPPPAPAQYAVEAYQVSPGSPRSDSQLRKRKAPAPPPTPTSVTPAPDTPDSTDTPDTPIASSSAPITPTPSLPTEDSGSELSHSTEDSDTAGSICSTSSSSMVATAHSASSSKADETEPAPSNTSEETDSALNLKLEDMENNRHSTIGADRQVPLKPRRTPTREPPQLVIPPPPSYPPPPSDPDSLDTSTESHMEEAPQSWLHSLKESVAGQTPDQEVETLSMGSSSSFPDQGYAASEGMAEDSGLVSSPSDITHPTSPEGSISAHPLTQPKDCSSDSDEGCATWGSGHRHSSAINLKDKSGIAQDSFEEDPELTAQLNQTLADLEANLADISHIDAVPVSVVDMDVPVTAIDEVLDDYEQSMTGNEAALLSSTQTTDSKLQSYSYPSSGDIQNKNNNARTSDGHKKASVNPTQRLKSQEKKLAKSTEKEEKHTTVSTTKTKTETKPPPVRSTLSVPERTTSPLPTSHSTESAEEEEIPTYRGHTTTQGKITHSPVSRFGMKTFTVVPPKPAVAQTQPQKPAIPPTTGAIKIDEQGNMVKVGIARNKFGGSSESVESPLLGKAKAFWSSTEKQDTPVTTRGSVTKARETEVLRTAPATAPPDRAEKAKPKETVRDVVELTRGERLPVESRACVPEPTEQPIKPPPVFSEQKRDLSFLKPPRRTSSQYVASAITKYAVKTSAKADHIQEIQSSVSMKKVSGSYGYQNEGQSIRIHPFQSSHTSTSVSGKKESSSGSHPAGPKRSMSYPDYMTEKQLGSAQLKPQNRSVYVSSLPGSKSFDSDIANTKHMPSSTSQPQKTLPPPHSLTIQVPVFKPSQDLPPAHSTRETTRPALAKKPEPAAVTNVLPEPNQVSLFGPVKKFKPVILKSVNKETTLHSTLMEAIQSGDQKRLRKISDSCASTLKKPSFVEEENQRSALMAAIRAQSNPERLKKTKSEAADDLDKFRKTEVESSAQCDTMPPPPSFVPLLPPLPPAMVPPPPPPPSTQPKLTAVLGAGGNPAMAREAMMEAIRSGSAAERLKKVTAPPKTIQVNGRLGTIQTTSSTLSQGQ